jgi:succinate-acetate transporter protein
MSTNNNMSSKQLLDVEAGHSHMEVANPGYKYFQTEEKLHGFLSQQFPTIANPAPLGLCAFALTTFVLSMYNTGAIVSLRTPSHGVVMGLALFYGGLCQLLAGMWEFKTGNTFGALAFSSYGGFWMSFAALFISAFDFLKGYSSDVTSLHNCLGIYLFAWCIFSGLMTIAAHRTTVVLFTLFFTVFVTFLLLAIGQFRMGDLYCQRAGGIWGLIAATIAWYAAYAGLLTKKNSLFTLPVGEMDPIWRYYGFLKDGDDCYAK